MGKVVSYHREDKPLPHELLLMYRQRSGLTQSQLAARLGLKSDRMIQKWEGSYTLPTAPRLQNLIELYLKNGVFISGREAEEAHSLWQAIKDMFDQNSATYESYPIFDEAWFEQLLLELRSDRPDNSVINPVKTDHLQKENSTKRQPAKPVTLVPHVSHLPIPANRLIGREEEIEAIKALLKENKQRERPVRLLTLTGAGGTGKTRLAIQVVEEIQAEFERAWFVSLAPVQSPQLLEATIAQALGLSEKPGFSSLELLQDFLENKQALLILDNFEHLLSAGPMVSALLEKCPRLVVLVTSRVVLRLSGEYEYPVAPLKLPPYSTRKTNLIWHNLKNNRQYGAIELFLERAQAVKPSFQLDTTNAEAIIEICHHLDGLPLALELAAVWIKILPPQTLLSRLIDNRKRLKFPMLAMGSSDLPERQQTIWASIDWSYSLLNQAAQTLLQRLAIFSGGWELEAAEGICAGEGLEQSAILEVLYHLVNYSLVVVEDPPRNKPFSSEPRFRLLETIRHYAWEKLQNSEELEKVQNRFLKYYVNLAEETEPKMISGEENLWRMRLITEIDNIRAAMTCSLETHKREERGIMALRIAAALDWFWPRFSLTEGRRWLELSLENLPEEMKITPDLWHAKGLLRAGHMALLQGDHAMVSQWCGESIELYRALNHPLGLTEALRNMSSSYYHTKDYEKSQIFAEESLEMAKRAQNFYFTAKAYAQLGRLVYVKGDYVQARSFFEETIRLLNEFDETITAIFQIDVGTMAIDQKDFSEARKIFKQTLRVLQEREDNWGLIGLIEKGLVKLALEEGEAELVPLLRGKAVALGETVDLMINIRDRENNPSEITRNLLGEEKYNKLYEQGKQMSLEQILETWEQSEVLVEP